MADQDLTLQLLRELGEIKGQMGGMQADIRTVKHDLSNVQQGMTGLSSIVNSVTNRQARGAGFWAGIAFVVTTGITALGVVIGGLKLIFGGH
jgi:hypothetical protein